MKIIKKYLYLIAVFTILGCHDDLLDKQPIDSLSPDTFYQNELEINMGLVGVYESIKQYETPIHWFQFDFMSDDAFCHHAWQGSLEFGEWAQNSASGTANAKWSRAFLSIVRANIFISNLRDSPVSEDIKGKYEAEARFLRAYMYYDLIHFYGDVPLILDVQSLENAEVARTPKNDVLKAIIDDLDFAAANLPLSYPSNEVGKATKGAALAYKARTLLYNENWIDAAEAAKEVMDLGVYDLFPNYYDLFTEEHENNIEVIFDIQYMRNLNPQPWPSSALSFGEWPTPNINIDLINAYYMTNGRPFDHPSSGYLAQQPFENRDPRMAATLVLPGTNMGPNRIMIPAGDEVVTGVRPRKYADLSNANRDNCGINTITMRYADILLMRAEALIESGNNSQEVYDLINAVRQRPSVNMPKIEDVEGTGLNQDQLRNILRHERRVEFPIEGLRYSDMFRWKDESLVKDVIGYNTEKLSDPSNPTTWVFEHIVAGRRNFDARKGWLWPIPQRELQNNENLTQNPGY